MTDYEFPACGAADEQGHPITCRQCIHQNVCCLSDYDPDQDRGVDKLPPCRHRFDITDSRCKVCSGVPKGVCLRYAT